MRHLKKFIPQPLRNIYHLLQAIIANLLYVFPSRRIKVIGVTGTNGKTTTVQMITKILEKAGKRVAMASTINFKLADKEWTNRTKYTTLSPFFVQSFIRRAVKAKCEYLVLETSSHSLDQHRIWGVKYQTAVITNVTREHLDYHKDMERYRKAKKKLFKIVAKRKGSLIVNLDMEKPEEFLGFAGARKIGYTTKSNGSMEGVEIIRAESVELGKYETRFKLRDTNFLLHLPGMYNVENSLAAAGVALLEKIPPETIGAALEEIKGVLGRMERIQNDKGLDIIVDYAVTPDSLEKLYFIVENMKRSIDSKIIAVLGSCGERDRGKRPMMGKIVSEKADVVILTNEDPYFEDPLQIIEEVSAGIKEKVEGKNLFKIMDRREAIRKALEISRTGDVIVVTGKGAEETMAIGKERISWNDKEVILEELKKLS